MLKLLVSGNLANTGFYLVTKLREMGLDVELQMGENPEITGDPKSSSEFNCEEYPNWIKFWNWKKNWKLEIIKRMRKYDLISAATELPIFALFSFKPYVAVATGSDLTILAQSHSLKGILLRLAYKRAKIVVYNLPSHMMYAKKIKLKKSIFIPLFRDFSKIKKNRISQKSEQKKFVIFHPTHQDWEIKKNNIFLEAFDKISKKYDNVSLVIINHGKDAKKSIEMINKLNLGDKCEILPHTLNQNKLLENYRTCDIVVDQFGVGAFGFIGLEVICQGIPLICYIEKDVYKTMYGESPPILSGKTSDEIFEMLEKLIIDKKFYDEISEAEKKWFDKFHSEEKIIQKYADLYKMVFEKHNYVDIINHLKFN